MARQSTTPVQFQQSIRKDESVVMTSGRAGVVIPVAYIPLLIGDSASGMFAMDIKLAEMPKPLLNAVAVNVQAWFVPKLSIPRFSGRDEFNAAYTGTPISALAGTDRPPIPFFREVSAAAKADMVFSPIFKGMGLHVPEAGTHPVNDDLLDSFSVIYNFRLAAHSSRLPRRKYFWEDKTDAGSFPRAFWPSSRFAAVVPDYERALVVGSLDLDVQAGQLGVMTHSAQNVPPGYVAPRGAYQNGVARPVNVTAANGDTFNYDTLYAEMKGQKVTVSLADIDKARETQAFAKLHAAYAGNDATGFDNEDATVAMLMQGFRVPEESFKRPWLLANQRVPVGFGQRFATDSSNLDQSVTLGRAAVSLRLNVPVQDTGGLIIITMECLPERLDERMADVFLLKTHTSGLPNALRDVQRTEPVDHVFNFRIDSKHTQPDGLYGYEPMNNVWNRSFTRLGGRYYNDTPGAEYSEVRSAIWQTDIVDPTFTGEHFLAPAPFPHSVFADEDAPAFDIVCRHAMRIVGLTQIGDILTENNDDYEAVTGVSAGGVVPGHDDEVIE